MIGEEPKPQENSPYVGCAANFSRTRMARAMGGSLLFDHAVMFSTIHA
jgi:hypothetical protein